MLALIGYVGAIPRRVWSVARQNPALKWALLALGVVLAVEVVAELGLKLGRDYWTMIETKADAEAKGGCRSCELPIKPMCRDGIDGKADGGYGFPYGRVPKNPLARVPCP